MITDKQFWLGLAATVGLSICLTGGLHLLERLSPYWGLSALTIGIFTLLSIVAFFAGKFASTSSNKHLFTNLIMGFTLVKMILSGMIVIGYQMLAEPEDKLFVLPFFLLYILFTAFEMFVMIKQARATAPTPK